MLEAFSFALTSRLTSGSSSTISMKCYTSYSIFTFLTTSAGARMRKPEGKVASTVKVGAKGQIVIPKEARAMFNIKPGDTLLLLADVKKGIAIIRHELFEAFAEAVLQARDASEDKGNEAG